MPKERDKKKKKKKKKRKSKKHKNIVQETKKVKQINHILKSRDFAFYFKTNNYNNTIMIAITS